MIKNQANIYQFVLRDMIGQGTTGLSPTVRIRKDSGSFAATTNTPTEVGNGLYEVALTATECNCDIMAIEVSLPDGQFPAILTNEYLTTTGGATPAEIWQYTGGRTVDNQIPTVNDIWGRQAGDTTSRTLTNLNIQSELTTYGAAKTSDLSELSTFDPSTDDVTINATQAATIATATDLDSVATKVELIKSKTDNLPASPAAVGSAMTLTEATVTAIRNNLATIATIEAAVVSLSGGLDTLANHGDTYWSTADLSDVSTFDPSTDAVTLTDAYDAAKTASQLTTFDLSALATSAEITALASVANDTLAGMLYWRVVDDTLITYGSNGSIRGQYTITKDSTGNIVKIEPIPSNDGN